MVKHSNVCQVIEQEFKRFGKATARVQFSGGGVGATTPSFCRGGPRHGTITWMGKSQRTKIRSLLCPYAVLNLHCQRYTYIVL